jgi:hypothetical protein
VTDEPQIVAEHIRKPNKKHRSRKARSVARSHDFNRYERELIEVLKREIKFLLDESSEAPLKKDRATALISYLKVTREIKEHRKLEDEVKKLEKSNEQK